AAILTSLMHGQAYLTSAELAHAKGTFAGYEANRESMLEVIHAHREAVSEVSASAIHSTELQTAQKLWEKVVHAGEKYGFRNAQVTVLAPTGTIGLLMDCDTTGVVPDFALVKMKKLVDGGFIKII